METHAGQRDGLPVVRDVLDDRVAREREHAQAGHGAQHTEHRGVLDVVVGDVEHAQRGAVLQLRDVLHPLEAVVGHVERVQRGQPSCPDESRRMRE